MAIWATAVLIVLMRSLTELFPRVAVNDAPFEKIEVIGNSLFRGQRW
jgi:hypothetical protein